MELSTEDKERIEQKADNILEILYHSNRVFKDALIEIAEYATIYEREKQIKTLSRPGSKYYVSYDPDYKDKVFGVFNKEDLTQQGAEKMAQQLNNLEAERSELKEQLKELTLFVHRYSNTLPHRIKRIITPILKEIDENQ